MLNTRELSKELWPALEAYMEYAGRCSGCWCMNHRMPHELDVTGQGAKLAMRELVETGRVFGVLAFASGDSVAVGWCAVDRRSTLVGHDCVSLESCNSDDDVWSIHCLSQRSDIADSGIEEALVDAAMALAWHRGATAVEVYPEPGSRYASEFVTWNRFGGHEECFAKRNFVDCTPANFPKAAFYRVMRCERPNLVLLD